TYKFANVTSGIDAFVQIEEIEKGAFLVNIDDSIVGYYDAWQPTVAGPDSAGSSYIKWSIEFKNTDGSAYSFADVDASAIDVDGDNSMISEFVGVNGQSSYDVPNQIPTLLTVTNENDTDNVNGTDASPTNLFAYGPIINRTNIDTSSQDVRINYHFSNTTKIKFYTGSISHGPGGSTSRYHSIYFMDIKDQIFSVLPVTYQAFDATLNNTKVDLFWITSRELNNDHFEVERSLDQKNFSTIGIILGAQSTNGTTSQYSFKDGAADLTNHYVIYYRLKQVDMNGGFSYSVVKVVRLNKITKAFAQISPNPYMDKLNINFESDAAGNAEVRLINTSGNIVKTTTSPITSGYNNFQLQNLNSQAAGLYIANIIINGKTVASMKVVKQ
ncbi:MAG: T9SS type A sorting domain-containing protein, partial [Ginsengibacter sp.]